jgi:hypothetical protein
MTERLSVSTAEHTSAGWAPAGETILQLEAASRDARVKVQVRTNTAAPWVTVGTIAVFPSYLDCFIRLPRFPLMRLVLTGNTAGSLVQVWDNE